MFGAILLALISERALYVVVRLSLVCRLSVTFVHPTRAIEIFGNVSTPFGWLIIGRFANNWYQPISTLVSADCCLHNW